MSRTVLGLVCAAVLSVAFVPALGADTRTGTVTAVTGSVGIDVFGKGAFVAAAVGDDLYSSSLMKTGPASSATIVLQGKTVTVPPSAAVKVGDLAVAAGRKGGLKWFDSVARLVKSLSDASRSGEKELVLGSRAAEADDTGNVDWDTGDGGLAARVADARTKIGEGSFAAALDALNAAKTSDDPRTAWQVSFWKGYCYYEMDDYADAVTHLGAANSPPIAAAAAPEDRGTLLFMLGSSLYLAGREKEAVPVLDAFLTAYSTDDYAPYAAVLLARSLAATGNAARSRAVAAQAASQYRGSDAEAELTALSR